MKKLGNRVIFLGKIKPGTSFIGIIRKPKKTRDRFGVLYKGDVRSCNINTKFGMLYLPPYKYGNKTIRITIEELP